LGEGGRTRENITKWNRIERKRILAIVTTLLGDIVLYMTRCSLLVGNVLVLILTWIKIFKQ
jgi:hypothetical protein